MTVPSIKAHCDELDQTFRRLVEQLATAQAQADQLPEQTLEGMHDSLEVILEDCEQSIQELNQSLALLESLWKRALGQTEQLAPPGLLKQLSKRFSSAVTVSQIVVSLFSNFSGSMNPTYNINDHLADNYSETAASSEQEVRKRDEQIKRDIDARNSSKTSQH